MKYIFLCLALIAGFSASAQFSVGGRHNTFDETHIKWDFTVSQVENKYTIEATRFRKWLAYIFCKPRW